METLFDKYNKVIGRIITLPDGRLMVQNAHGMTRGYYNPKTNQTTNVHGGLVGRGNFLTNLITQ